MFVRRDSKIVGDEEAARWCCIEITNTHPSVVVGLQVVYSLPLLLGTIGSLQPHTAAVLRLHPPSVVVGLQTTPPSVVVGLQAVYTSHSVLRFIPPLEWDYKQFTPPTQPPPNTPPHHTPPKHPQHHTPHPNPHCCSGTTVGLQAVYSLTLRCIEIISPLCCSGTTGTLQPHTAAVLRLHPPSVVVGLQAVYSLTLLLY
ncbi:hypothetical protein J6590_049013 [Homalodisca vitripennis]|nr:hypothetical protein J6590_049013 [Homalodisca vitripennis]